MTGAQSASSNCSQKASPNANIDAANVRSEKARALGVKKGSQLVGTRKMEVEAAILSLQEVQNPRIDAEVPWPRGHEAEANK